MCKGTGSGRLREVLSELEQSGSPVDLSVADPEAQFGKVQIEQVGGYHESAIFELEDERWAFRADLAITNQTSRPIDVVRVDLRTPWDCKRFEWLPPLEVKSQARGKRARNYFLYKFPGTYGLQLPYDEVINRYLIERRRLPAKRSVEGWLLGVGDLMPSELRHGQRVTSTLVIIGADHTEYSTTLDLWTDRLEPRPKGATAGESFRRPQERQSQAVTTTSEPYSAGPNRSLEGTTVHRPRV